jgi:NAD+ synthase
LTALNYNKVQEHIVSWLSGYLKNSGLKGFVVGISGGIDSAVTSTLCALTGAPVYVLNMPIRQRKQDYELAANHITDLKSRFSNVAGMEIELSGVFSAFESIMPESTQSDFLAMANSRSRLRMMTLYAVGQSNGLLVAGTGNKVEDFGVGFYTKYGDGGVDLSPIADLMKTEVYALGAHLQVIEGILNAKPTDGLWEDGRSDEDQLGASYPELEWAMLFSGDESTLTPRQSEVLGIYRKFHRANQHKMLPIPVCLIPDAFR